MIASLLCLRGCSFGYISLGLFGRLGSWVCGGLVGLTVTCTVCSGRGWHWWRERVKNLRVHGPKLPESFVCFGDVSCFGTEVRDVIFKAWYVRRDRASILDKLLVVHSKVEAHADVQGCEVAMDNGQTFLQSETDFNRLSKWITAGINRSEGFSRCLLYTSDAADE